MQKHLTPAKTMPLDVGIIHLVGIGGIGMSGIAEILYNLGYKVTGSDVAESANVLRLRKMGIMVVIGHDSKNIKNASVVVKSSAVALSNPEIIASRENNIPVVKRSEMLAELTRLKTTIAVAGSHGKTTTTSLISHVLEYAGLDPTVINGGIINSYGTNAHLGESDWLVTEADESDGTFIKIPASIGVITNMDAEHLDFWKTYDALKDAFRTFIENLPFYGFAVLCYDHNDLKTLAETVTDRRIISYAIDYNEADVVAKNIRHNISGVIFDVKISLQNAENKILKDVFLPLTGKHNILNALAAITVALELNINDEDIIRAFVKFSGVKRRFTQTGITNGITIIDDYAHHPVEISATLAAAKDVIGNSGKKIIAVMQPHRYTRLEQLFVEFCNCFSNADKVIISDVYAAGEQPIDGVNRDTFVKALEDNNVDAIALPSPDDLAYIINDIAEDGDIVICLGAGTITEWANELPATLAVYTNST